MFEICQVTLLTLLGLSGCVGLLGLVSPAALAKVASYGNRSVFEGPGAQANRRWIDIDQFVVAHGRLFGACVVGILGYLFLVANCGPEAYTKSSFLAIVAIAMLMGFLALWQIRQQSKTIQLCLAEAQTDPLTGLTNRRVFEGEVARRLAQKQRLGTPLGLLIIDVDYFKNFNDSYGHVLGDAVLKRVAEVLKSTARQVDIVARLGGDEFVVLLPDCHLDCASAAAERMRTAISQIPLRHDGAEYELTVSIGVCEALSDDDPTALIKRSDSALYAAKEAGRNCCFRHGGPVPAIPAK